MMPVPFLGGVPLPVPPVPKAGFIAVAPPIVEPPVTIFAASPFFPFPWPLYWRPPLMVQPYFVV